MFGEGWNDATRKLYKVNSIPSTWLIDKDGVLQKFNLRGEELHKAVCELVCKDENGNHGQCIGGVCSF